MDVKCNIRTGGDARRGYYACLSLNGELMTDTLVSMATESAALRDLGAQLAALVAWIDDRVIALEREDR